MLMFPMTRSGRRLLAAMILLLASSAASAQQLNWLWWKQEPSLKLTADQSSQIDAIFQEGIARLRDQKIELDRQEGNLSGLIASMVEEAKVVRQIDRVESIRAEMNKTRTLLLLHMRQVLTPEQRAKLNALRDRREQERLQRERNKEQIAPGEPGKRSN
jgi:Spy/CpxP family protein refolding chaperone